MLYEALSHVSHVAINPLTTDGDRWLKIFQPNPAAKVRLYCFSHVGGAASIYKHWAGFFSRDIEVCAIQLPGREERKHEVFIDNLDEAVKQLKDIVTADNRPFVFFGHSFGSILAYALAVQLKKAGVTPPCALLVSAKTAPHLPHKKSRANMPRIQLIEELVSMGGTPDSILKDEVLMDSVLRIVRADYTVLESFSLARYYDCLACPIVAFEATFDSYTSSAGIDAWSEYTCAGFNKHLVDGGHFYLNDYPAKLFAELNHILNNVVSSHVSE